MNRNGFIGDSIVIMGVLFILAIVLVIGVYLANKVNVAFQGANIPDSAKTMTNNLNTDLPGAVDFVIACVLVGLPLVSMILSFFNNVHPLFFFVSVGLTIMVVMCGIAYSVLWANFTASEVGATSSNLPMTNFFLTHFGIYSLLVCMMILIGLYVKLSAPYGN